jgi:hypothetical protein
MAQIRKKEIKEKAERYSNALLEGAPAVEFKGRTQAELAGKLTVLEAKEAMRANLMAQVALLEDEIDDGYIDLDVTCVDIRSGVEGHKDFGDDCPLYGAMGHVRKSERRSGLKRNKPNGGSQG